MSKAEIFADEAVKAGWTLADKAAEDTTEIITIAHDGYGARMVMVWERGCYIYAKSSLVVQGHQRTVRNASEGRRFLAGVEAPKTTIAKRPKRKKAISIEPAPNGRAGADQADVDDEGPSREELIERRRRRLPFKVSSPAADILKSVVGKEIVWQSSLSGDILSAQTLPDPDQKQLRIEYNRNKKRILTFAARGEGFRSVYVESIIEVN